MRPKPYKQPLFEVDSGYIFQVFNGWAICSAVFFFFISFSTDPRNEKHFKNIVFNFKRALKSAIVNNEL